MPNWCLNTLTIEGPADDNAKGLWLARHEYAESDRPDVRREIASSDGTMIPCYEFDTIDEPPAEFLRKLSRMLPGALVKCAYWEPFGGKRGFLSYSAGELFECQQERFVLEELPRRVV
jgi:hypothetical protein